MRRKPEVTAKIIIENKTFDITDEEENTATFISSSSY